MIFKEFLMDQYIESERPLKDMIPDGFNDWMDNQDVEDICDYAERWKKQEKNKPNWILLTWWYVCGLLLGYLFLGK